MALLEEEVEDEKETCSWSLSSSLLLWCLLLQLLLWCLLYLFTFLRIVPYRVWGITYDEFVHVGVIDFSQPRRGAEDAEGGAVLDSD